MLDVQRAIRYVRANAEKWKLDNQSYRNYGFILREVIWRLLFDPFDAGNPDAKDAIVIASVRAESWHSLLVPRYFRTLGRLAHAGSKKNLLGDNPDPKLVELMSNENRWTKDTPPTFIFHTVRRHYC